MSSPSIQRAQTPAVGMQPPPPPLTERPHWPPPSPPKRKARPLPRWRTKTTVGIVVLAVLTNFSLRLSGPGLVVTLLGIATVGLLGSHGRLDSRLQRLAAALIVGLSILFSIRTSAWVTSFGLLAIGALLGLVATNSLSFGSHRPWVEAARSIGFSMSDTGPWLRSGWRVLSIGSNGNLGKWARSLIAGLITTSVLVALLVSADPAFGWLVSIVDIGSWLDHVLFTAVFVLPATVLALVSSRDDEGLGDSSELRRRCQAESRVAIWCVAVTLTVWCGLQIAVISGGAESVLAGEGITPAEYARQGFFQLVAVAAVSLSVLNISYRLGRDASGGDVAHRLPAFIIGSALSVLIIVTYSRLGFYVGTYGMTMLRLSVATFLAWLSLMTILSVVRSLGFNEARNWLSPTAVLSAAALTLGFGLVNPEAWVATINLERASAAQPVDGRYFSRELSDDAKPVVAAFDWESIGGRSGRIDRWLCRQEPTRYGWLGWNLSTWDEPETCDA